LHRKIARVPRHRRRDYQAGLPGGTSVGPAVMCSFPVAQFLDTADSNGVGGKKRVRHTAAAAGIASAPGTNTAHGTAAPTTVGNTATTSVRRDVNDDIGDAHVTSSPCFHMHGVLPGGSVDLNIDCLFVDQRCIAAVIE